jgi:hypothetical protein
LLDLGKEVRILDLKNQFGTAMQSFEAQQYLYLNMAMVLFTGEEVTNSSTIGGKRGGPMHWLGGGEGEGGKCYIAAKLKGISNGTLEAIAQDSSTYLISGPLVAGTP